MTDGPGSNLGGVIGAGLTVVGGLAVAGVAVKMTQDLMSSAKTAKKKSKKVHASSRVQNSIDYMLGK